MIDVINKSINQMNILVHSAVVGVIQKFSDQSTVVVLLNWDTNLVCRREGQFFFFQLMWYKLLNNP